MPGPLNQNALVAPVGVLWAQVTERGAGAHVLGAEQAVNAFTKAQLMVDAVGELEQIVHQEEKHPAFEDAPHPLNYNVGIVRAGDWPSSVPSECTLEVRISAYPGADLTAVQGRFREHLLAAARRDPWLAEHPPEIAFFGFQAEGCVVDPNQPLFEILGGAHRRVMAAPLEHYVSTATTDARFFALYQRTPATCYGPIGGNLHAPDEWVDLASLRDTTRVLAITIVDWCGLG
jgi:acetylornithine deacetylase